MPTIARSSFDVDPRAAANGRDDAEGMAITRKKERRE
jgi:hypothetical protein